MSLLIEKKDAEDQARKRPLSGDGSSTRDRSFANENGRATAYSER